MSHQKKQNANASSFIVDFLAGGLSGSVAKTIAAPVERVKILLQTKATGADGKQYTGILNCFARVIKEEGVFALWRGNMSNIIRYFPTQAINFSVKDQLNRIFCKYDAKKEPGKFFVGKLLSGVGGTINGVFDFIGNAIISIDIPFFASGGFPDAGDIFVANEAGPELIGTIGGKTAVGGGEEITGIRDAVYDTGEAQASLLSSAVELLRIIAEKDTSISLDGRELVDAMNNRNSRNGYNF